MPAPPSRRSAPTRVVLRRDQAEAVAKGICAARQAAPVARLLALDDSAEPGDLRYGPPGVLNKEIEVHRRPMSGERTPLGRREERHRALRPQDQVELVATRGELHRPR